jgi:hypothetical protein
MKSATQISAKMALEQAAERIRQALDTWNGADLKTVAGTRQMLEHAVDDLKRVTQVLTHNPAAENKPRELRRLVDALRAEVGRMTQVVDACSAFQNGMAVRLGGSSVTYDVTGCIPVAADSVAAPSIEG